MHEFFGSTAYLRGAEVVLGLQMLRDGYSRLHFFKDRDGDLPLGEAWGSLFDRESGYRRDPDDGKPKQTAAHKVSELLQVDPGMTIAQLVEASGYAERTVKDAAQVITRRRGLVALQLETVAATARGGRMNGTQLCNGCAVVVQSEIQSRSRAVGLYKRTSACTTDAVEGAAVVQFQTHVQSDKGPPGRTLPAPCVRPVAPV